MLKICDRFAAESNKTIRLRCNWRPVKTHIGSKLLRKKTVNNYPAMEWRARTDSFDNLQIMRGTYSPTPINLRHNKRDPYQLIPSGAQSSLSTFGQLHCTHTRTYTFPISNTNLRLLWPEEEKEDDIPASISIRKQRGKIRCPMINSINNGRLLHR